MIFGFIPLVNQWGELIQQLTQREIKARYKQSILGYAWVVLAPLLKLTTLSIVFKYFFKINTGEIPYSLFLFTALVPWTYTANAVSAATSSLIANAALITKIKMPRVIFPISAILVKLVDLGLSTAVLLALMLTMGQPIYWTIIWLPLIFLVQMVMTLGVSLILSALNVFYRDVENLLEVFLMIWMYLSPVIYPPEYVPETWRMVYNLNPMVGIINAYRNTLLYGVAPPWESFGYAILVTAGVFIIGWRYFQKRQAVFADVI
ncbi:hypothetical protein A2W24_05690 [Microgenomates group bacterium RBG_16_45_19]|nr:MAG: hypothetical protein A2W24_05690 [Microgenomates group bacterium RBG_16_45_19]